MNNASEFEPVIDLANEYLERYRNGEQPTVEEYVARYPDLADQIRDVFPMMLLMEDNAPEATETDENGEIGSLTQQLERLGDFRILREIGRGGMGIVYEAVQESLGRHVALKVFPRHSHLNPRHQERFKRESRSAAMLHHTNIVPVFAVGDDDGMLYYAMQLIRGAGLDEVITELNRLGPVGQKTVARTRTRPQSVVASKVAFSMMTDAESLDQSTDHPSSQPKSLSDSSSVSGVHLPGQSDDASLSETGKEYWHSVARIGVQVAEALDYAHTQGTLHRDIKPSNLLLDQDATVWVTDFGLAKSLQEDDLTHTGELVGTLRYMPPEQFSGNADERSDLYSLGLTLYELVTLRPAFDMPDRQRLVKAITDSVPPRPRKLNSRIPRDLETIVLKSIEREPGRRYQNAQDLADDLTRFLNNEPLRAKPVSSYERFAKWARRRPAIASLAAALLALFVVSFGLVTWKWQEAEVAKTQVKKERDSALKAEQAEREAKLNEASERKRNEELLKESKQNLYYSLLAQADFQRQQNDINAARRTLDSAPENLRNWEWHYLSGQLHLDLMTLDAGTEDAQWSRCLSFSGDGRLLATGSSIPDFRNAVRGAYGAARVWDLATGKKILDLGDQLKSVMGIALSPDGSRLATTDLSYNLRIWDVASGAELVRTTAPSCMHLKFSPDGSLLIGKSGTMSKYQLRVWDAISGRELWTRRVGNVSVEFSPDSAKILTCLYPAESEGNWAEFDSRTGEVLNKLQQHAGFDIGNSIVVWGPDSFRVFDKATKEMKFTLPNEKNGAFATSPDGNQLASVSLDGTIRLWDMKTGQQQQVLRGHSTQLLSIGYSPDGQYLASGDWDGNFKVWHLNSTRPYVRNLPGQIQIEDIAFRFGGRALATVRYPNYVHTWDSLSGDQLSEIRLDMFFSREQGPARHVAFNAAGDRIAGNSNSERPVVKVWDVETGQEQISLPGHETLINFVTFSQNDQRVATAAGNFPRVNPESIGRIKVWDVRLDRELENQTESSDRQILEIANPGLRTTALAFTSDGTRLAVAGYLVTEDNPKSNSNRPFLGIWEIDNTSPKRQRVYLDADDALAGASGSYLPISTNNETDLRSATDINCLAFSPDGQTLATAHYRSGRIHFYDANTGTKIIHFDGPTGIQALSFSPDGERLAGANRELTTIWDTKNGHEVITLRGKPKVRDEIFNPAVRFSDDGRHLASTQFHDDYSFLIRSAEILSSRESKAQSTLSVSEVKRRSPQTALNEQLAQLNQLVQENPDDWAYRLARGRVKMQLQDYDGSLADYAFLKENVYDNSLFLTGFEHVRVPHLAFHEFGSFTLETWVKNWQMGAPIAYQGYGYAGSYVGSTVRKESTVQFWPSAGSIQAGQGAEGNYSFVGGSNFVFRFGKVDPDQWTHYAVVYDDDADEIRCYTNGQLSDTTTGVVRIGPFHPERPFWIGYHSNMKECRGQMRSFRMSRTARYVDQFVPEEQLQADDETTMMFDFTNNESYKSTRITDQSGSGNHGELIGAWWLPMTDSMRGVVATQDEKPDDGPATGTQALWANRIENLTAIVDEYPENGAYRWARSKIHAASGNLEQAREDYLAAVKLRWPDGHHRLLPEQFVAAPHIAFDEFESFTIEAWVRNWTGYWIFQIDALQPGISIDQRQAAFCFRRVGDEGYEFEDAAEWDKHAYRCQFTAMPADQWNHLALVRDGNRLLSFVNGQLVSTVENVKRSAPFNRGQPLWIGGVPIGNYMSHRTGSGTFGTIRISNTARYVDPFSPAQQLSPDTETILMYDLSKLGELTDSQVEDLSDNGNHGRLHHPW